MSLAEEETVADRSGEADDKEEENPVRNELGNEELSDNSSSTEEYSSDSKKGNISEAADLDKPSQSQLVSQAVSEIAGCFNKDFESTIEEHKKNLMESSLPGQDVILSFCDSALIKLKKDLMKTDIRSIGRATKEYNASVRKAKECLETVYDDVVTATLVAQTLDQSVENFDEALNSIEEGFC